MKRIQNTLQSLTTRIRFAALAVAVVGTASLADEPPAAGDSAGDSGQALYLRHCASCHGPAGRGDGQEGRAFEPPPTDFTEVEPDAARFETAIRDGGMAVDKAGTMPAFRHTLGDEEIQDVVAYLMQLQR
ncbi:MAG: cytochrome c [Xanthomonadaceae bacterium]|nr:cytochrome c [Xanthomonadaceae bacterium]